MAHEMDIGEIVKICKVLLLDIEGTTTSISFVKDKLFPYAEENVKQFLDNHWENKDVKEAVCALRKLALEDQENSIDGVVSIPGEDASKEDQIEGLVNNVKWQMSSDRKAGALKLLQGLIWKQGYDKGDIKGHVYDDVSPALEQWRAVEGQKVYIYSSGSVQAQKLLFGQSSTGDLLPLIDGHFDTAVGAKQETTSYTAIVEKIGCKPEEILFLTDILKEAEAARTAGLHAALVSREGNAPLPAEAAAAFPVLHSLAQLTVSNKRKTDPPSQDVQPAKVPKTETENDAIKSETTSEVETPETVKSKESEEPEKMDVDQESSSANEIQNEENKQEEVQPVRVETIVEEITDEPVDAPVCDIEPVVIEEKAEDIVEKTEEEETEKMDADGTENVVSATEPKVIIENGEKPASEEITPTVVTEIEEISDKQSLEEVAEIIEDLEPVVEEPTAADIEELQNVGEVLEKECDEILSKVQDVTNLDNIPIKPLLNPIAEETMETENVDSNDIVERILDTELDLDVKPCEDIDLNSVTEITEQTKTTEGESSDKVESSVTETNNISEAASENNVETNNVLEEKVEENSIKEAKSDSVVAEAPKPETEVKDAPVDSTTVETETPTEEKVSENRAQEVETESKDDEMQVNGKTVNNENDVNVNGDASKNEELSSRLSVENGKEVINGSNGDSNDVEKVKEDDVETPVSDIKVKTVATDEPRTDPIEQPTEA